MIDILYNSVKDKYPTIQIKSMSPQDLIFEDRVRMNCFYCGKYGRNWRCPPNLPNIDYQKMMCEFDNGAFVWVDIPFDNSNFQDVRTESSVRLHRALLDLEKVLYNHNCPMALSFIAGSCKLCKDGCGKDRCNNPYLSRSPLEATGVNIIKSVSKYGINISFPPKDHLMRIGLILW